LIRPVLYVNLPGIVRAFERRARTRQGEFAHFVVAPELEESRSGLTALLTAVLPVTPHALTWISEDHWRLLGLAQVGIRPGGQAWDLTYLAALASANNDNGAARAEVDENAIRQNGSGEGQYFAQGGPHDDTLMELTQHALNAAIMHGAERFFTRVEADAPELTLFTKLGFQRYALETTYLLQDASAGLERLAQYMGHSQEDAQVANQFGKQQDETQAGAASDQPDQLDQLSILRLREEESNAQLLYTTAHSPLTSHTPRTANRYALALATRSSHATYPTATASALAFPGERLRQRSAHAEYANASELADQLLRSWRNDDEPLAQETPQPVRSFSYGTSGNTNVFRPEVPLRKWRRHDAWGLMRLYDACTPRRVQVAESLNSAELLHTRAAGGRTWYMPLLEPPTAAYVCDRGDHLGGWVRIRMGRGAQPHLLNVLAHPDEPAVALALVRFALQLFAQEAPRPIICLARAYENATADALFRAGFTSAREHALLVRRLTARLGVRSELAALDSRVVYGVKGLGTNSSRLSESGKDRLCQNSSTTISKPCSPSFLPPSGSRFSRSQTGATSSRSC